MRGLDQVPSAGHATFMCALTPLDIWIVSAY